MKRQASPMPPDRERVLLTMAAEQEARRQAARQRGDEQAERQAENEIRRLWRAHSDLTA